MVCTHCNVHLSKFMASRSDRLKFLEAYINFCSHFEQNNCKIFPIS